MNIISNETYHIYNQGNNREIIFIDQYDYTYFLTLFKKFVLPKCKVFAYCLMPNHFHFLIHGTGESDKKIKIGNIELSALSNAFRLLQSNYATYFNSKHGRTGSLFRQKTKAKPMNGGIEHYGFIAFHYIHQNPLKAGLVSRMEDWPYSSFREYLAHQNDSLCDHGLCFELIGFDRENFLEESYRVIDEKLLANIF